MRLTIAAAAFVVASGAAFAQATPPQGSPQASPQGAPPASPAPAPVSPSPAAPAMPNGTQTPSASLNTAPGTQSPSPSAVQTTNTTHRTASAPVPGRNSFTKAQAARRIASAGYTNVTGLKKSNRGIWRGHAQKDGNTVSVSLDYQGNVTGQ